MRNKERIQLGWWMVSDHNNGGAGKAVMSGAFIRVDQSIESRQSQSQESSEVNQGASGCLFASWNKTRPIVHDAQ
jgi:hypothetical protein